MASTINRNLPATASTVASDVMRSQFGAAADDIEALQNEIGIGHTFDTYQALRDAFAAPVSLEDGTVITLNGGITLGDSGWGKFSYKATDNTSVDDGGYIIVDAQNRRFWRLFDGKFEVDKYCPSSPLRDVSSIGAKAFTTCKIMFGATALFHIAFGPGTYQLDCGSASSVFVDGTNTAIGQGGSGGATGGNFVDFGFIRPNIKYTVKQSSPGGSIIYANVTYTDGQTFVGLLGYKSYKATNARPYFSFYSPWAFDGLGTTNGIVIEDAGPGLTTINVIGTGLSGYCGVGIAMFDSSGQGKIAAASVNLQMVGANDPLTTPQTMVFWNNRWGRVYSKGRSFFQNCNIGFYLLNCWNCNIDDIRGQQVQCTVVIQNCNEMTIGNFYNGGFSSNFAYLGMKLRDSAATNLSSVVVGDTVDVSNGANSKLLHCVVDQVGYWDGGTTYNDMLILRRVSETNGALVAGSHYKFTSGALNGTELTLDYNQTTSATSPLQYERYLVSRLLEGIGILMSSAEGLNLGGNQASNVGGEADIVWYANNASTSNFQGGQILREVEGPASGLRIEIPDYQTLNFTTSFLSIGAMAMDINISWLVNTNTPVTNVGQRAGVWMDGAVNCHIHGSGRPSLPTHALMISPNCANIDFIGFIPFQSADSNYGILDRQAGTFRPCISARPYTPQLIQTWAGVVATTGYGTYVTSRRLRTNTNDEWYGMAATFPMSVDLDWTGTLAAIGTGAAAKIALMVQELNDAGAVIATRTMEVFYATEIAGETAFSIALPKVRCNKLGQFNAQIFVSGAAWSITSSALTQNSAEF